ncbi:IclR family transcriptional regulator [Nocardia miyunensis]|uniref:IclR family transcriptional regulator n=1 Tax=Nocardia miyunensis TaxID=282684 RepID=UPI0008370CA2|nr:IclR family transcriptional regulator [Nocardia miyunensis]
MTTKRPHVLNGARVAAEGDSATRVRAVERAGQIVTALAEHPYPMGIVELAHRVQLSPGSVHRLLATLIRIGWVEQNLRTAKYRLGTRMLGIGTTALITNPVIQHGKTYIAQLSASTGHDALLSTLVGLRAVYLARTAGVHGRLEFEPGVSQPAHAMADGKMLLTYLPEEERRYLYGTEGLRRYTDRTITDPEELEKELDKIRKQGYATDDSERIDGVRSVAVPVLDHDGRATLAMLSLVTADTPPEEDVALAKRMLTMAREFSDQLQMIGDMPMPAVDFARYNLE